MAEKGDPFEVHPAVKQAIEQSAAGMDQYFEFLKKNLASFPTGGARRKAQGIYRQKYHFGAGVSKKLERSQRFSRRGENSDRVHAFAVERLW